MLHTCSLLNRDNLALEAIERINIARRILGQPELTLEQAMKMGSHSDEYLSEYWNSSMSYGSFWTTDQAAGKPNFIEGGQTNGFGYTQSTFHKLHCLSKSPNDSRLAYHWPQRQDDAQYECARHPLSGRCRQPASKGILLSGY